MTYALIPGACVYIDTVTRNFKNNNPRRKMEGETVGGLTGVIMSRVYNIIL